MWVYGRENTFRHTVGFLAEALQSIPDPWNVALCTDDIDPADLLLHGHMDRGLRVLLDAGVDPALAVRFATLNGAVRYGLHDLGAIAPGKLADIVLAESFTDFRAKIVLAGGRVVARDGQFVADFADPAPPPLGNTVRIGAVSADTFRLRAPHATGDVPLKCIDIDPVRTTSLGDVTVRFVDGECALPLPDGVTLLSVVPRHGQSHPPTLALLRGLPLRDGALATTVAHDSHNLIVAGRAPEDMAVAVHEVARIGGGVALAVGGAVVATVRLPVAGLMSDAPVEAIAAAVRAFNARAGALGLGGASPVLAISSLALPVAPFVRITDRGVVDTLTQQFIPISLG
jgi:adenine deaminase